MSRHSSDPLVVAERVVRRVKLRAVWTPILIAALGGFGTALAVVAVLLLAWHPDGIGI